MRLVLVLLFTAAVIVTGQPRFEWSNVTLALASNDSTAAHEMLADLAEDDDDVSMCHALPLDFLTSPEGNFLHSGWALPRHGMQSTNRHQYRDDLYSLKRSFLI